MTDKEIKLRILEQASKVCYNEKSIVEVCEKLYKWVNEG